MSLLLLTPAILSLWLFAAHVLRAGLLPVAVLFAIAPLLLLVRHKMIAKGMQLVLGLAALEWVRSLVIMAMARLAAGQPWLRMAIIIGVVALITALAAVAFAHPRLQRRYR